MENNIDDTLRKNIRSAFEALQSETNKFNTGDSDFSENRLAELADDLTELLNEGTARGYSDDELHLIQHGWN